MHSLHVIEMNDSPWTPIVKMTSPDGALTATLDTIGEVCMGGPTRGPLIISNGMRIEDCNPSIMWSDDSRFIAVPQWTETRSQKLVVIDVKNKSTHTFTKTYQVLAIESFKDGLIQGIDSPIHNPKAFSRNITELKL
tara:strand:- start:1874 stop:2284 length:411 start_codon:yes stop_codon:yes gene_type:complete